MDTGSNGSVHFEPNMDSIAEIRVLTSAYAAEYGRNANGTISVITKGGSREFHGSGWNNWRHEQLNANTFFNNRNKTPKSLYRYDVFGYSIGGPVYIPNKFNSGRNKLFFFFSQEYTRQKPNSSVGYFKMPTAAELGGDFSGSTNSNGALLVIKDPLNNNAAFPGNRIDPSRISSTGLAFLKYLPEPNYVETDPALVYSRNYRMISTPTHPRRNDIVRADFNLTSKLTSFFRYGHDYDTSDTFNPNYGVKNSKGQRAPVVWDHPNGGHGYAVGITYTISPTTVNEFNFGKSWNTWDYYAKDESQLLRSNIPGLVSWSDLSKLPKDPKWYGNYLPYFTFSGGSLPGAPSFGNSNVNDAEPRTNWNDIWSFSNNISRVSGSHNLKAGVYVERTGKTQGKGGFYTGNLSFGSSSTSPLDTANGYANALLGLVQSYQEGVKTIYDCWFTNIEPFVQDNWRVTKKLTVDLGLRLYGQTPYKDLNGTFSAFYQERWDTSKAPRLYTYGYDANKNVIAVDPKDPTNVKPKTYAGLYVQNSPGQIIGDPANGWKAAGTGATYTSKSVTPAVRVGLAYDVFGNGTTAIRGGFGQFYNRFDVNQVYQMSGLPPVSYLPQVNYLTLDQLAVSTKQMGPSNQSNIVAGDLPVEGTIQANFGIQQKVPLGAVVEASYVGAFRRHTGIQYDVNHIAAFSQFDPKNANPTAPTTPLPDHFFRPYQGMGQIFVEQWAGSSNYNSLQVSANRRFSKGFSFGLAYTFMKLITVPNQSYYFDSKTRWRGQSGVPHLLVVNYVYEVPGLGAKFHNKILGGFTDKWTLSGITTISSGAWSSASFSYSTNVNQTGSALEGVGPFGGGTGARINVLTKPSIDSGEKTFFKQFNTDAFAAPTPCSATYQSLACFGNGGVNYMLGPGWTNWDMTLSKQIPIGLGERRALRFRAEAYNVFNHPEFNAMGTAASFNLATGARITSGSNFGQLTGTRTARQLALTLRFEF
jgi:hypothetical protein